MGRRGKRIKHGLWSIERSKPDFEASILLLSQSITRKILSAKEYATLF
jgi:hypothetical protein